MKHVASIVLLGIVVSSATRADPPGEPAAPQRPPTRIEGQPLDGLSAKPADVPASPTVPPKPADAAAPAGPPTLPPRRMSALETRRRDALVELRDKLFPPLLTEAEVDRWGVACELGPDGIQALRDLLVDYRANVANGRTLEPRGLTRRWSIDAGVNAPVVPNLDESALVAGAFQWDDAGQRYVARFTPIMLQLLSLRNARLDAQNRAEQEIATRFIGLTDEAHKAKARRLAFVRLRQALAMPGDRGALTVDLVECVEEAALKPDELAVIAAALDAYVQRATLALAIRAGRAPNFERSLATFLVGLGPGWELVHECDDLAEIQEDIDARRRALARLDEGLRDLAYDGLAAVTRLLPPSAALAVQDRFWQRARPECFDDETELTELVRASIEPHGGVARSADEITSRLNLLAMTRLRLMPLGFEAAACADELAASSATGPAAGFLSPPPLIVAGEGTRRAASTALALEIRRLDLMRRRRAICADTAMAMRGFLTADEAELSQRVTSYARDLEARSSADAWTVGRLTERLAELRHIEQQPPAAVVEHEAEPPSEKPGETPPP